VALAIPYDDDLAEITADLPTTVVIGGTSYTASVTPVNRGERLGMAGTYGDEAVTVTLRVSVLAAPSVGTAVTIGANAYRVVTVVTCPSGTVYDLVCEADNA
jgi:hypothetical protein